MGVAWLVFWLLGMAVVLLFMAGAAYDSTEADRKRVERARKARESRRQTTLDDASTPATKETHNGKSDIDKPVWLDPD